MAAKKVLIIGGGLAGLSLAQILRRNKIDYEIFERDHDALSRAQGWALTLRECLSGLYKMFPDDMPPLEESISIFKDLPEEDHDLAGFLSRGEKVSFGGVMYNTGEKLAEIHASDKDDLKHHWIRVNRADFREWLSHNLTTVHWDKQFVKYEETDDGVIAYFADGTSYEGDILVACDGAHSKCRAQLVGADASQVERATHGSLTANIQLQRSEYRKLLEKGNAFITATAPKYHFFLGTRKWNGSTGEYYWSVTWDDKAPKLMENYAPGLQGEAARQLALDLCSDLHPSLRQLIENTTGSQMLDSAPQLLQWAPSHDRLGSNRVTLVGDALHTMVPFRGAGANTAILDVLDLAQLLLHAEKQGKPWKNVIPVYEGIATPRGRRTKELSKDSSLHPDPGHWARTMTLVFDKGYEWEELDLDKIHL